MPHPRFLRLAPSFAACVFACSIPPSDATITVDAPSESATEWYPVENYLDHRCGGLDCHGAVERNLIVYGCYGLRLDTDGSSPFPGCPPGPDTTATTDAEYAATYRSLVGLEPVVMSDVVASGGQDVDLLTFVRKARGEESHKGGTLITPGDVQDQCITLWLAGSTNAAACAEAIATTP
jgi:hypothetical protein